MATDIHPIIHESYTLGTQPRPLLLASHGTGGETYPTTGTYHSVPG